MYSYHVIMRWGGSNYVAASVCLLQMKVILRLEIGLHFFQNKLNKQAQQTYVKGCYKCCHLQCIFNCRLKKSWIQNCTVVK